MSEWTSAQKTSPYFWWLQIESRLSQLFWLVSLELNCGSASNLIAVPWGTRIEVVGMWGTSVSLPYTLTGCPWHLNLNTIIIIITITTYRSAHWDRELNKWKGWAPKICLVWVYHRLRRYNCHPRNNCNFIKMENYATRVAEKSTQWIHPCVL